MAKLYITDWLGHVHEVEASESKEWFDVPEGAFADRYFRSREGIDFHLHKEKAEMDAISKVETRIARMEFDRDKLQRDIDKLQARLEELQDAKR